AVRGVGPAGGWKARCAAATPDSARPMTAVAIRLTALWRIMAASPLRRRRVVAAPGAGGQRPSVRELYRAPVAGLRSVLRQRAVDRDRVADLQRIGAPAVARERIWRSALALPRLHGAFVVLHVQIDPDVRVLPFEFRHRALQRDRLVRVELGGKRVMGNDRLDQHDGKEKAEGSRNLHKRSR